MVTLACSCHVGRISVEDESALMMQFSAFFYRESVAKDRDSFEFVSKIFTKFCEYLVL